MAQRVQLIVAQGPKALVERVDAFIESFSEDPRFIITPFGFAIDSDGVFIVAVRVEATHKRTFIEGDSANAEVS